MQKVKITKHILHFAYENNYAGIVLILCIIFNFLFILFFHRSKLYILCDFL
jgi:hypothetical protein